MDPEGTEPPLPPVLAPVYGIELDKTGTHTFVAAAEGYGAVTPLTVTVTNTGNQPTGALTAALSGDNPESFVLSAASITDIPAGGDASFTVGPITGLTAETYTATVTVSGDNSIRALFTVRFTVAAYFDSVAGVDAYLADAAGGTSEDPVPLALAIDLSADWTDLLSAIETAGKYAALDLSASTMTGAEFDPGEANTGEKYVVSLALPGGATGIKAGADSSPAFRYFTALESLSGANIETVGDYAFSNCTALESVSLPAAASIGDFAFSNCTALESVSLPGAVSIGRDAFYYCTSLASVSLPSAVSIGFGAFIACSSLASVCLPNAETLGERAFVGTSLAEVSLPNAETLGERAFAGCASLASASLPNATSLSNYAFYYCASLASVSLPEATSIGSFAFSNCTALESVSLPKAQSLGEWAFSDCTSLASVSLDALASVGDSAFYGCSALASASLPKATSIGDSAFCLSALASIDLRNAETLGDYAFSDCTALESVSLPAAASIGDYAFYKCTALASIDLPQAASIGFDAFSYCTALASVVLPQAASIGDYAFAYTGGGTALTVTLGETAPTLGGDAFYEIFEAKTVTVLVPAGTAGYGTLPGTYTGNSTAANWGNGFRGGGWDGAAMTYGGSHVNVNISLTIQGY